jgi:hypothetical protein
MRGQGARWEGDFPIDSARLRLAARSALPRSACKELSRKAIGAVRSLAYPRVAS